MNISDNFIRANPYIEQHPMEVTTVFFIRVKKQYKPAEASLPCNNGFSNKFDNISLKNLFAVIICQSCPLPYGFWNNLKSYQFPRNYLCYIGMVRIINNKVTINLFTIVETFCSK